MSFLRYIGVTALLLGSATHLPASRIMDDYDLESGSPIDTDGFGNLATNAGRPGELVPAVRLVFHKDLTFSLDFSLTRFDIRLNGIVKGETASCTETNDGQKIITCDLISPSDLDGTPLRVFPFFDFSDPDHPQNSKGKIDVDEKDKENFSALFLEPVFTNAVPEPAMIVLVGPSLVAFAIARRKVVRLDG